MEKKEKKFVVPNRRKLKFLWFVCIGIIGIFSVPAVIIFVIGSLPTLVSWAYNKGRDKTIATCVGLMNVAGCSPFVMAAIKNGHDMALSGPIMEKGSTWLIIYGLAAVGWGIHLSMPKITQKIICYRLDKKTAKIKSKQKDLIEEWGNKVRLDDPFS